VADVSLSDRASYSGPMAGTDCAEKVALVALLRGGPTSRWPEIVAEVLETGSAKEVRDRKASGALIASPDEDRLLMEAESDIQRWAEQGLHLVTIVDEEYPSRLRGVHEAPPVLFTRGILVADDRAVSVVGSRGASERGLSIASTVARELASAGVTVVSGLAAGIDTAAHRAALDAGGRTVAVIGTGINKVYPFQNRDLQEEIAHRGLVLSQFWPDETGRRYTFPMRNVTMSGYGMATIVVEARETSGTRIQARAAVGHGRPVILTDRVVGGNRWAKELAERPGVHVAAGIGDVLSIVSTICDSDRDMTETIRKLTSV
jgi:DNA processing protein